MWDPSCLVSYSSEETRSVYHVSTPPTPLLDEAMLLIPSKPGQAKEEQQSDTEDVEEVGIKIKNKNTKTAKRLAKGPDYKTNSSLSPRSLSPLPPSCPVTVSVAGSRLQCNA